MKQYQVFLHQVEGNDKDGYEVNDNLPLGFIYLENPNNSDEVFKSLKKAKKLPRNYQQKWLEIESVGDKIVIDRLRNGCPLYTLSLIY